MNEAQTHEPTDTDNNHNIRGPKMTERHHNRRQRTTHWQPKLRVPDRKPQERNTKARLALLGTLARREMRVLAEVAKVNETTDNQHCA
jgi:hypothetical protein